MVTIEKTMLKLRHLITQVRSQGIAVIGDKHRTHRVISVCCVPTFRIVPLSVRNGFRVLFLGTYVIYVIVKVDPTIRARQFKARHRITRTITVEVWHMVSEIPTSVSVMAPVWPDFNSTLRVRTRAVLSFIRRLPVVTTTYISRLPYLTFRCA